MLSPVVRWYGYKVGQPAYQAPLGDDINFRQQRWNVVSRRDMIWVYSNIPENSSPVGTRYLYFKRLPKNDLQRKLHQHDSFQT